MTRNYIKPGRDVRFAELAGWRRLAASRDRRLSETGTKADGCPADNDPAEREYRVLIAEARIRPELERIERAEQASRQARRQKTARREGREGR